MNTHTDQIEEIHWRDAKKHVPGGPKTVLVRLDQDHDPEDAFDRTVTTAWFEGGTWHVEGAPAAPVLRWAPMPKGGDL